MTQTGVISNFILRSSYINYNFLYIKIELIMAVSINNRNERI